MNESFETIEGRMQFGMVNTIRLWEISFTSKGNNKYDWSGRMCKAMKSIHSNRIFSRRKLRTWLSCSKDTMFNHFPIHLHYLWLMVYFGNEILRLERNFRLLLHVTSSRRTTSSAITTTASSTSSSRTTACSSPSTPTSSPSSCCSWFPLLSFGFRSIINK